MDKLPKEVTDALADRQSALEEGRCIKPPIGCGQKTGLKFRDFTSFKEYKQSGLCQKCQDNFFKEVE